LRNIVYIPGVVVNGKMDLVKGISRITISGTGAHGTLVIKRATSVEGTLDGQRIELSTYPALLDGRSTAAPMSASVAGMSVAGVPRRLPPGSGDLASSLRFSPGFLSGFPVGVFS